MAEKEITSAIMRYLKSVPECFCWKEHGGMYGTAGLPDIICCIKGRFVAFEVKAASGRLTKLQEATMRKIKAAKGEAYNVTSVEDVRTVINGLSILENLEVGARDSVEIHRQTGGDDRRHQGLQQHAECHQHYATGNKGTLRPDDQSPDG
ncbi:VRR-NUC domain-containing protein [Clostridium thermosuccinogenes]|jgi:hypothetical protein|uniref:VRR-NUC domain-containing protein n=1 Tax=Clostridium thermosuccinogenes TaxID=84032 RepID=UPI001FA8411A|nr:VRR-NUC domain-containing protein [Pseudoclostridium thermosuccinogenes]